MSDLAQLHSLSVEISEPSDEARARARGRLLRHIRHGREARRRHRLVLAVAAIVLAPTVTVAAVLVRSDGASSAAAATLRHAAAVARKQPAPAALATGHYRYTRSVQAYLVVDGDKGWAALGPKVREVWIGRDGGREHETSGTPKFLSARDRALWVAAGKPQVNDPETTTPLPPARPLDLPTDRDTLYHRLAGEAAGHGSSRESEIFTLVGDDLRETDISPAERAALYEVAARIPGVELLGTVTDRIGRRGVAVAYSNPADVRHELIFDPTTSVLLEERYVALAGNSFGYPAGTLTGYSTYVASAIVDRMGARPMPR